MASTTPSQPEAALAARTSAARPTARRASPAKAASAAKATRAAGAAKPAKAARPSSSKAAAKAAAAGKTGERKAGANRPAPVAKPERVKLVRDSFTMPKSDVELLAALKQRCLKLGHEAKKSELLRAGLHALAALQDEALVAAASSVPRLKTGRPGQKKNK